MNLCKLPGASHLYADAEQRVPCETSGRWLLRPLVLQREVSMDGFDEVRGHFWPTPECTVPRTHPPCREKGLNDPRTRQHLRGEPHPRIRHMPCRGHKADSTLGMSTQDYLETWCTKDVESSCSKVRAAALDKPQTGGYEAALQLHVPRMNAFAF